MTVEHIAERLNDRFNLLTQGSRTALPRQQTLRATIDWSYDLLSDQERILFRRELANLRAHMDEKVFADAWTEGRAMGMDQAIEYALEESNG